jgi:hypothetical protein
MDLGLEVPRSSLDAVMSHEVWEEYFDRLAELIRQHRTTRCSSTRGAWPARRAPPVRPVVAAFDKREAARS